jgi:D-aspartate ligase
MRDDGQVNRFLRRCGNSARPGVIVLGSSVNGLSYVRSLGRRGIPVLCADAVRSTAAASRHGDFVLLDRRAEDEIAGEYAMDDVIAQCRAAGVRPVVLGSADEWQVWIARRAAQPDSGFDSFAPSLSAIDHIVDKQSQYECARACDIPIADFANAEDVRTGRTPWTQYPAIIKPRWSHSGRGAIGGKATLVANADEMRERLERLREVADAEAYLVQKVVRGGDDTLFAYLGCLDSQGREVAHVIKRKLRQHPPSFGDGCLDMTCRDIGVAEPARLLLRALAYRGLVGVEFKRDPESGEISLIEINPRTVSTNQLAITAGVDFPWIAYHLAQGKPAPAGAKNAFRVDVRHIHEERDFRAFIARRRKGEAGFFGWLRELLTAQSFAIWNVGDPMPLAFTVWDALRRKGRGPARVRGGAGSDAAGRGSGMTSDMDAERTASRHARSAGSAPGGPAAERSRGSAAASAPANSHPSPEQRAASPARRESEPRRSTSHAERVS